MKSIKSIGVFLVLATMGSYSQAENSKPATLKKCVIEYHGVYYHYTMETSQKCDQRYLTAERWTGICTLGSEVTNDFIAFPSTNGKCSPQDSKIAVREILAQNPPADLPQSAANDVGLVRDEYDRLLAMNRNNAQKYCESKYSHLPSIRELAEISEKLGAKGILEVTGSAPTDDSYILVEGKNIDGTEDKFYFSNVGHTHATVNGYFQVWSSSRFGDEKFNMSQTLDITSGKIQKFNEQARVSVLCLPGLK